MPFHGDAHQRRSIRLPAHNYASPGAYFVTIVIRDRECLLGDVVNGEVLRNPCGDIVAREWARTAAIRSEVRLDSFVVMPNHLHAVVYLRGVGAHGRAPLRTPRIDDPPSRKPRSLGALVAGFKSSATKPSTSSVTRLACPCGSATTTNASSATRRSSPESVNTSATIPPTGKPTPRIRAPLRRRRIRMGGSRTASTGASSMDHASIK